MAEPLWKWDNDPAVTRKKCSHCNESMLYDRASAVQYQGNVYHSHCLLTKLTEFHNSYKHLDSTRSADSNEAYLYGVWP